MEKNITGLEFSPRNISAMLKKDIVIFVLNVKILSKRKPKINEHKKLDKYPKLLFCYEDRKPYVFANKRNREKV